jgi:phosphoribosylcarboxyaminoimidazole (NCAIR) mutase
MADRAPSPGLLTFVALAGGFAVTGAFAAAKALDPVFGTGTRCESVQSHGISNC